MKPATKEKIKELQRKLDNVRNICILAHVDHGKLRLTYSVDSKHSPLTFYCQTYEVMEFHAAGKALLKKKTCIDTYYENFKSKLSISVLVFIKLFKT